jgi:hypothetical protein
MSEQKDFDRYLKGEYYPGAIKTKWRIETEADFAKRGISLEAAPKVFRSSKKTPPVTQGAAQ